MPGITNCFSSFPTQGEGSKARTTSPALCRSAINFYQFPSHPEHPPRLLLSHAAPVACDHRTANLISDRTSRAFVPPSTHGAQPTAALRTRFFYRGSPTQPFLLPRFLQRTIRPQLVTESNLLPPRASIPFPPLLVCPCDFA